jgi:hypothetical protein
MHLYWPEVVFNGVTLGDDFPILDLDIGKVRVIICYDSCLQVHLGYEHALSSMNL